MSHHPETIVGGVTTGHNGVHEDLAEWWNSQEGTGDIGVPAGATQSDIAAALALAHSRGFGRVRLHGDAYTATGGAGTVAFDISLPTVSLDMGGATITYTGSGVCVRTRMDPMTNTPAGLVSNGTIDGTGAGAGAVGFEMGQIVGAKRFGVTVQNFSGVGSVGWDFYNATVPSWMERCVFLACESRDNTIDYRFRAVASAPSFLYNNFADLRFNVGSGQTAFKTVAPAQLFDCFLGWHGNVDDDGTIFDLAATSIIRPFCHITVEQTNGSGAILFAPGSDQMLYPDGVITAVNFPDDLTGRTIADYAGRGVDVVLAPKIVSQPQDPFQAFGLTIGSNTAGWFVTVYDGGVGSDLALLKIPFGGTLADGRIAAQLDSVTSCEVGFRPGNFSVGVRPAANNVPVGTGIYLVDLAKPAWSDGTDWRDAAGTVV